MKRMWTLEELIQVAQEYSFDPSSIQEGSPQEFIGLDSDGELAKTSLFGKFVRVIDAPESGTVDQATFDIIKEGVFMNGTWLGLQNPIVIPFDLPEGGSITHTIIIAKNKTPHSIIVFLLLPFVFFFCPLESIFSIT